MIHISRKAVNIAFSCLLLLHAFPAWAAPRLVPLTAECIVASSKHYKVPVPILLAVLATERGKVGEVSHNKNGTVDVGPMQINTVHFEDAKKYGLTPEILTNNGCANFAFASWYLSTLLAKYDVWEAIGIYHSRTPHFKAKYQGRAWSRLRELDVKGLLREVNGLPPSAGTPGKSPSRVYDPVTGMVLPAEKRPALPPGRNKRP